MNGDWTTKAREMVQRNRTEGAGDTCAHSVYADRLLQACGEIERLQREQETHLRMMRDLVDGPSYDLDTYSMMDVASYLRGEDCGANNA